MTRGLRASDAWGHIGCVDHGTVFATWMRDPAPALLFGGSEDGRDCATVVLFTDNGGRDGDDIRLVLELFGYGMLAVRRAPCAVRRGLGSET